MESNITEKISGKNIRATALPEFWGNEFDQAIYLWPGAKHTLRLSEFEGPGFETYKNLLSTKNEVKVAYADCVNLYYSILPKLANKLNEMHGLNLSVSFWQITFGFWLFRHICNVYEKYAYLEKLDLNSTSITLLAEESFYVPPDHNDYFLCFSHDFGVQQLVSQYFYFKNVQHPVVKKSYKPLLEKLDTFNKYFFHCFNNLKKYVKRFIYIRNKKNNPQIALLGVFFSNETNGELFKKSAGAVDWLSLPIVRLSKTSTDIITRKELLKINAESDFERYFLNTILYCTPKAFVENFKDYYNQYSKDLSIRTFTHIVSESWISEISVSIYVALAKEHNRKFIVYEHGNGTFFYKNDMDFICFDVADVYLSIGWKRNVEKLVPGGFSNRVIRSYDNNTIKKAILYISRIVPLYEMELIDRNLVNSNFIDELRAVDNFIELLPAWLEDKFVFRPRLWGSVSWEAEFFLNLEARKVKIDYGIYSKSIQESRIIIIDHIATGLAEILLVNVPFILLYDYTSVSLYEGVEEIIQELRDCSVIHVNADSAVKHVTEIYDDVQGWWQSPNVKGAINKLLAMSLAPSVKTTDYLLSLVN